MDPTEMKHSQASPGVESEGPREFLSIPLSVCTIGLWPYPCVSLSVSALFPLSLSTHLCLSVFLCLSSLSLSLPFSLWSSLHLSGSRQGEASQMPRAWHLRRHPPSGAGPALAQVSSRVSAS